ncbi:ferric reduction oxidase 2 isoform X1 [Daucus carota subsp. sativus]|uniref:ferric reduction oxidase 2 isoform X1 n=1 Tax=Daucus carota subsp. sativus TaxID=79200 RepID=UPI0007EF7EE8|nr:PREDICTED: ferric reduction oxidase 2-like isoform X1 [Daucus carota subsp. sativus]
MEEKTAAHVTCSNGKTRLIQTLVLGIVVIIFLGYSFMWIMMPTSAYREYFYPKIRAQTNSTFFGTQGTTILVYTFPVLLISVLGSVYLHLGLKLASTNSCEIKRKSMFSWWKRPMIIRCLGIVSWIELFIFVMFIALLVWTFSAYLHYFFNHMDIFKEIGQGKRWEAKLSIIGLTLGIVGNICLTFLFFPVTRTSSVLPLLGLTSEASIKYHIWLGHITMFLFTAHGLCYIVYWAVTNRLSSKILEWKKTHVSNVAGEISLLFGLALWVTTFPRIRRKMFELFFYTHYLYILFIVFFIFHLGFNYFCYMLPGFYLFMVDRFLRFLQSRQCAQLVSARVLPCETVELNFSKDQGLSYTPTSIIFINVPSISKLQWHPYTISSSSHLEPEILSVIIKSEGSWTRKLYQKLASPFPIEHLQISVEGPYGPASTHFLSHDNCRHDKLIMVTGGSGIAPFISIIHELLFMNSTKKCRPPRILLISAFKNSSELTMLNLILPISNASSRYSNLELQVEAYVTREMEPPTESPKPLQTIWFKSNTLDAPISTTLGQYSWLWLGVITSSSFIIFLLTMGFLTRFYIYPIDHNTNKVFSNSLRSVLNMLLMCISILVTASAAFLWNKKQSSIKTNQVKKVIELSPLKHNSWVDTPIDRELESLPYQSLLETKNVHYGRRPDLRGILMEHEEASVGVLVCGPKSMRHQVANICSSSLAKNLHFESISFSW